MLLFLHIIYTCSLGSTSVITGISKLIKEVREANREDTKQMGEHLDRLLDMQERHLKLEEAKFEYMKKHGGGASPN